MPRGIPKPKLSSSNAPRDEPSMTYLYYDLRGPPSSLLVRGVDGMHTSIYLYIYS